MKQINSKKAKERYYTFYSLLNVSGLLFSIDDSLEEVEETLVYLKGTYKGEFELDRVVKGVELETD